MNEEHILQICEDVFGEKPDAIERCAVGQGNYVYIVECAKTKYVFRCSEEKHAYKDTIYWLEKLSTINIPVPRVIAKGCLKGYEYLILSYFEGKDIGLIYQQLKDEDKKSIAKEECLSN